MDFFNQTVTLNDASGEDAEVLVRTAKIGECSQLNLDAGEVVIDEDQPLEGKAIGLLFQLIQLGDIVVSINLGREKALKGDMLHVLAPSLLVMLSASGLLNPALKITSASIIAHVQAIKTQQKTAE